MKTAIISATLSGDNVILSGTPGKRIRVLAYTVSFSTNNTAQWKSGSTLISGLMHFASGGNIAIHLGDNWPSGGLPVLQTEAGEDLILNLGGAITAGGHLTYVEVMV
ncbi:hypothetical protein UFOVP731_8 [uncultured Caudovirales phage]|uniref:Uncharacterized protein n=1 Tax=uncultured Caudovirales phage TaxID=2100421 RepID=A0A6J5NNZ3_9CAUD|nr:hypothetical protein UFOVP731_8 [uncultured Caudovirales phage]